MSRLVGTAGGREPLISGRGLLNRKRSVKGASAREHQANEKTNEFLEVFNISLTGEFAKVCRLQLAKSR